MPLEIESSSRFVSAGDVKKYHEILLGETAYTGTRCFKDVAVIANAGTYTITPNAHFATGCYALLMVASGALRVQSSTNLDVVARKLDIVNSGATNSLGIANVITLTNSTGSDVTVEILLMGA